MLYVFVEGPDDESFVSKIFSPYWEEHRFVRYAGLTTLKIDNFLKSINRTSSSDYIFLGDADGCSIDDKKAELLSRYKNLSAEKTYIVQYEIESWYYAGADQEICRKLKLKHYTFDTDTITKEQFYSKLLRPTDRKYVMACLLNQYLLDLAVTRNNSLNLFVKSIREESVNAVC